MSIKNIFLDLDNTIISSVKVNPSNEQLISELKRKSDISNNVDYYDLFDDNRLVYVVFTRPHLDTFLDFLFENFNVSIWTAGTRCYASFIIKNIFKNRNLNYILFDYHVNLSNRLYNKQPKNLNIFYDHFDLPLINTNNTLIIDDNTKISDDSNNITKNYKSILCTFYDISKDIDQISNDNDLLRVLKDLKERFMNMSSTSVISTTTIPSWEKLGWLKVASQSRPGQFSFENKYTGERIPDPPKFKASMTENESEDLKNYD
tara:strand:- start:1875 stop:2657 length:783 start_codon:yes stop_codon:yes gene_type:complete